MSEVERKWLVKTPDTLIAQSYSTPVNEEYMENYLSAMDDVPNICACVRSVDDRTFTLVFESQNDLLIRNSFDQPISKQTFQTLAGERTITKSRCSFRLALGAPIIEVDTYSGKHSGLVVAQVQFPTEEAAAAFDVPPEFGLEVTSDEAYKNENLARK